MHVRVEGNTVYVSGTGTVYREDCEDVPGRNDVTSVVLEEGITGIGNGAFGERYSSLTSVNLPSSRSIGSSVFRGCPPASINLPDGLKTIGQSVFYGCGLTSLTLPANVESVGMDAIFNCHSLPVVRAPSYLQATAEDWCWKLTEIEWY